MLVACRRRERALPDARWRAGIRGPKGLRNVQLQARPLYRRGDRDSRREGASVQPHDASNHCSRLFAQPINSKAVMSDSVLLVRLAIPS